MGKYELILITNDSRTTIDKCEIYYTALRKFDTYVLKPGEKLQVWCNQELLHTKGHL